MPRKIGQVCDECQVDKKPESEALDPLNFRFVAACCSGKIVKIDGSDLMTKPQRHIASYTSQTPNLSLKYDKCQLDSGIARKHLLSIFAKQEVCYEKHRSFSLMRR